MLTNKKCTFEINLVSDECGMEPFRARYNVEENGNSDEEKDRAVATIAPFLKERKAPKGRYVFTLVIYTSETKEYVDSDEVDITFDGESVWFEF